MIANAFSPTAYLAPLVGRADGGMNVLLVCGGDGRARLVCNGDGARGKLRLVRWDGIIHTAFEVSDQYVAGLRNARSLRDAYRRVTQYLADADVRTYMEPLWRAYWNERARKRNATEEGLRNYARKRGLAVTGCVSSGAWRGGLARDVASRSV